jgi:ribosomal protein S27AE
MTFIEYMRWALSGSTIGTPIGEPAGLNTFKLGATGTTISYIADIAGVLTGALIAMLSLPQLFPYCDRCGRFTKREQRFEMFIINIENLADKIIADIKDLINKGVPENVLACCEQLAEQYHVKNGNVKITVDHRICPQCKGISIVGTVHRLTNRDWHEDRKLRFFMNSQPQPAQIQPSV